MKLLILTLLLLTGYLSACPSSELKTAIQPCKSLQQPKEEKIITDDKFMLEFIEEVLAWHKISALYHHAQVKRIKIDSPHSPKNSNYLVTVTHNQDFLSYYLSDNNAFPLCVIIHSHQLDQNSIFIGQDIDFLQKIRYHNKY